MATLTLKNVPEELVARLKREAAKNRRSLNQEVISRLEETSRSRPDPAAVRQALEQSRASRKQFEGRIWVTDEELDEMINTGRP
jgi:plasmid stability protein